MAFCTVAGLVQHGVHAGDCLVSVNTGDGGLAGTAPRAAITTSNPSAEISYRVAVVFSRTSAGPFFRQTDQRETKMKSCGQQWANSMEISQRYRGQIHHRRGRPGGTLSVRGRPGLLRYGHRIFSVPGIHASRDKIAAVPTKKGSGPGTPGDAEASAQRGNPP